VIKLIKEVQQTLPEIPKQRPVKLSITPDGVIKPFHQSPSRLSFNKAEAVKKQVDEWLDHGIIRKPASNVASRVVVVKTEDGTLRVCIDYKRLNHIVLTDRFPASLMEEVL